MGADQTERGVVRINDVTGLETFMEKNREHHGQRGHENQKPVAASPGGCRPG